MDFADYHAIQNLIFRYCDYLDRGDFHAMGQLFAHADVYLGAVEQPIRSDAEALADMYQDFVKMYADGTPRTRHVTTNLIIEADGPGHAWAQSYVTVFQSTDALSLQPIVGGRNLDKFINRDGVWYFSERRVESDMWGYLGAHMLREFGPDTVKC